MLPKVKETHGKDPIHPNKLGHNLMAVTFLEQWPSIRQEAVAYKKITTEHKKTEPAGDAEASAPEE